MSSVVTQGRNHGSREFVAQVARYYRDFLETDFRKTRAPGRQVRVRDEDGNPLGFNIRRYPELFRAIARLLEGPFEKEIAFTITRGQFTQTISRNVRLLLEAEIHGLEEQALREVVNRCVVSLRHRAPQGRENFDAFVEDAQDLIAERVMKAVVTPLIETLQGVLRQSPSIVAEELLYEIEDDIAEHLIQAVRENLPPTLVTLVRTNELGPLLALLNETIGPAPLKAFLVEFFSNLATGDAYEELLGIASTMRLKESLELYLYLMDLNVKPHQFPVTYIPILLEKAGDRFVLHFDNRLFFNRRALKYAVDQHSGSDLRVPGPPTNDRIHFLFDASPQSFLEDTVLALTDAYRLPERIRPLGLEPSRSATAVLQLTNAMHLCAFAKGEEAIVNDYEEILLQSHAPESPLNALFDSLVNGCILEEPKSVRSDVDKCWEDTPRDAKLVYESPVPLNEEQRKLLLALQNPSCKYCVVEGPPGTGKSHTITAIVFDAIMRDRSVLVLSDKNEALDVVEDKLTQTLNKVRPGNDFQNPILRLGRTSGTYAKILRKSTRDRIQRYFQAARGQRETAKRTIESHTTSLKESINQTVEKLSSIQIQEIMEYERLVERLGLTEPSSLHITGELERAFEKAIECLESLPAAARSELSVLAADAGSDPGTLIDVVKQRLLEGQASLAFPLKLMHLNQFQRIPAASIPWLQTVTHELVAMRNPVFGYLFRRSELAALAAQFIEKMPLTGLQPPHKRRKSLKEASDLLSALNGQCVKIQLSPPFLENAIDRLKRGPIDTALTGEHLKVVASIVELQRSAQPVIAAVWPVPPTLKEWIDYDAKTRERAQQARRLLSLHNKLSAEFERVPPLDLQKSQAQLQHEHTAALAHRLDENVLAFLSEYTALATTLKTLIQQRKPFPRDRFQQLKKAFPCIIAGIREFADYIPLEPNLVDIVIIDEASQVSIAQAFPALLRAKQVVVLGDEQQFANVKTSTASRSVNQEYMYELERVFRENFEVDNERIERMKSFDVRTSILRFFDLVKHFEVMLRKHFRGYSELISFSSKYFYNDQLQAIRIRARPVSEVLKFTVLNDDELPEITHRNANEAECDFVHQELMGLLELDEPPSVGVITPFREQQKLVTRKLIFDSPYNYDFSERLNLKIMTFDSCQGEERDVIFYTMAATQQHDRLNYVFPTELQNWEDGVDRLKAQRLNVGFSRARETIHFILSKPIEAFRGTVRDVLRHYEKELAHSTALPSVDEVDPNSPMEAQVLQWLRNTGFYRENAERLEVLPQFPIGDYLKQLDPFYKHPLYRVDFLVLYQHPGGRKIPVIIEYDGFREHFQSGVYIDATNYEHYYRQEDVERQFILESYGYNFLRINRFNLGQDPVVTLSKRLYGLIATRADASVSSVHTEAVNRIVQDLESGDARVCNKCGQVKSLREFKRQELKSGYGRYCNGCHRRGYG